jgi:hypothetical protein
MKHRPNVNSFFPGSVKYVKYRKTADTGGTAMRKIGILGLVGVLAVILSGCGGGSSGPDLVVQNIISLGGADDGYIGLDALGFYTVFSSETPNTIEVSDDPADSRRGFISFSLSSIPFSATIRSATVFLPVLRATPFGAPGVTILVDMVSFPSLDELTTQGEIAAVYGATAILQGPSISILPGDAGFDRTFDATDALNDAIFNGDPILQFRLIGISGDVTFDDLLQSDGTGTPLLRVEYF